MSWSTTKRNSPTGRDQASVSEVEACFRDERDLLFRPAWLIAGDRATAEQSVVNACNMTVQGHSPFRDWMTEWAKSSTIISAISKTLDAIRSCEPAYKDLRCLHPEHRAQDNDAERCMSFLFGIDPGIIIAELDPLARSVLVLRTAIRASIQDCALRLNVSRSTMLAANCRAVTWLRDRQSQHHTECG